MKPKHPPGPPMTLGNMRELGVHGLVASCLNDACRHVALIDVSSYLMILYVPASPTNILTLPEVTEFLINLLSLISRPLLVRLSLGGCSFQFGRTSIFLPPHLAHLIRSE